jgi:hypothetical protein
MRIFPRSLLVPRAAALAAVVLVAVAATALAAGGPPTLVAPADNARVTSDPVLRWTLPSGADGSYVEVGTESTVGASGNFNAGVVEHASGLKASDRSWQISGKYQLWQGTWFWHVATLGANAGDSQWSDVRTLRVAPQARVWGIAATATPGGVHGTFRFSANGQAYKLKGQIVVGHRSICAGKLTGQGTLRQGQLSQTAVGRFFCSNSTFHFHKGARVTVLQTLTSGAAHDTDLAHFKVS